jgi:hypothetical protein
MLIGTRRGSPKIGNQSERIFLATASILQYFFFFFFHPTLNFDLIGIVHGGVSLVNMGSKPYFGLRGNALLRAALFLVVCPTFTCYGYNMGVTGGLLTLDAFNSQFPRMDTIHTQGTQKTENSQMQGWSPLSGNLLLLSN